MKILITGFDPFGGESINPAWEAVKAIPSMVEDVEIIKVQIPTVFNKSVDVMVKAAKETNPDVILCVGQAGGRFDMTVERVAINIDDARIKDNEGNQPIDNAIYEDGESAYFTTLPIKAMVAEMHKDGCPASVSNTAGTFVCNHIMYALLYNIAKNKIAKKGGFIHVPYIPEQVIDKKNVPYMETSRITKSLIACIKAIKNHDSDLKLVGGAEF
ncbi:MAG: pyroglutamyl-peptidase I [Cetobacterium sp.]|uniref:pyroglutamyl-peptidase I n=1 Tax=unclassified Cetobacterium TaxID=2630983 RepID=UPI00163CEDD0|nr:pyroglutamyl-peptidase I [Cetobacterium sp. 2A]MBC2856758.1 pyroglutamyl-peptidase I [Cetobacterium sp. 2A]